MIPLPYLNGEGWNSMEKSSGKILIRVVKGWTSYGENNQNLSILVPGPVFVLHKIGSSEMKPSSYSD